MEQKGLILLHTCIAIIQGTERVNTIAYMYCDNTIFQATYQVYPTICNTNGKLEKKMNFKDFFFYINHFIIIVGDRVSDCLMPYEPFSAISW